MMWPSTYIRTLLLSATSAEYYPAVLKRSFWFTLTFFLISYLCIGAVLGVRTGAQFTTFVQQETEPTKQAIRENFPSEGSIVWNGEQLTVTPDPFYISFPPFLDSAQDIPDYVLILTNSEVEPQTVLTELGTDALAISTPTTLYTKNYIGEWTDGPLAQLLGDRLVLVTPQTLSQHLITLETWLRSIEPTVRIVVPFIFPVLLILHRLWIVLVNATLVYVFLRINQVEISFGKSYQLLLQMIVPLEIVNQLAHVLYPEFSYSLLSLGIWILVVYVFLTQRKELRTSVTQEK